MGWAAAVEPITCTVSCNGAQHRLHWAAGELTLADHDIEAELALRALGGPGCTCLEVADLWRSAVGPAEVYALWTTSAEWPSDTTGRPATPAGQAITTSLAQRLGEDRRHAIIASLPLALRRRRALQALAELPAEGEPLHRIVASLATPGVLATLPPTRGAVDVRICLRDGPAELRGEVASWGGWARLDVSPRWVPEVWATSQTCQSGGLVLGLAPPDGCGTALHVARWFHVARWLREGDRWVPRTTLEVRCGG